MKIESVRTKFQSTESREFNLHANCIDIWQFSLTELPEDAFKLLDDTEQQRAERFYFPQHRIRFIAAHAITRLLLAQYLKKSAASIKFATNHYGKPYVDCSANLQFNLSHSSNLGLLAVGWKYSLGIDLEFFSLRDYRGIAKHSFSSQELKDFYSLPAYYQPYSFFHIWAQKEAFIKATGLGLSYGLQEFDVSCWPVPQFFLVDKIDKKPWKIIPFMPKIACTGAICCHELIKTIRYQLISYEQLTL